MRAGRHFAEFARDRRDAVPLFGIIRPGKELNWSYQPLRCGHFYNSVDGRHFLSYDSTHTPGSSAWTGMQPTKKQRDRIGLLLDLEEGTLTVYKNDQRLGVMASGLWGEYCWAAGLRQQYGQMGSSIRISAGQMPEPQIPT